MKMGIRDIEGFGTEVGNDAITIQTYEKNTKTFKALSS